MKYNEKLNAGYILSLQKEDNQLSVKEICINYPDGIVSILDKLEYFEENPEHNNVFSVERFVHDSDFEKDEEYSYCWPYDYHNSFIQNAKIEKIDREKYYQKLEEIEQRISLEYELMMKPKKVGKRYVYLNETRKQELEIEKKDAIRKKQEEYRRVFYLNYIEMVRRYVFALHYKKTIETIKEKSLMYSSEAKGWYGPNFNITGNARIGLRTNFCYGRSAYFDILLNYKGINILPYSDLVNYYWSNMMDNLRFTRSYTTHRNNWPEVLTFIADICNWIERDPVSFEKKWIIDEVEQMMDGLKEIHGKIEEFYKKLEEANKEEGQKRTEDKTPLKTIKYRNINATEIYQHKIYPHETLLIIQVDKLAAALSLLDDLSRLTNIYTPVANYINTIVQYNKEIVPAIKTQCNALNFQILKQEKEVKKIEKSIEKEDKNLEIRANEIDAAFEMSSQEYQNNSERLAAKTNNRINDKEYRKIQERLSELKETKTQIEIDIDTRQSFKTYLEGKKEYITECLKQRGNVK